MFFKHIYINFLVELPGVFRCVGWLFSFYKSCFVAKINNCRFLTFQAANKPSIKLLMLI